MLLRSMRNGFFSALFLGLLVLGGFSLVLTDWNGMFRNGGVTKTDVAVVNGTPIKISEFNAIVSRILRNQRIDTAQAYEMGLIDNILQQEVLSRIIGLAARDYGIHVEDKYIAAQIEQIVAPLTSSGADKKQALAQFLQMQGITEKYLVQVIRSEIQGNLLKSPIGSVSYIPDPLVADISAYKNMTRTVRYIELPDSDIKLEKQADEATLETYYKTIERQYMLPETRDFKIAVFDASSVLKDIVISDQEIQSYYDENKDTYLVPEKRTLEQAILKTESDAAQVVSTMKKKGQSLEEAVKSVTGDKKSYAGKNSFAKADLTTEMAAPVFDAAKNDVVGPIKSPLGYHVFKIEEITPEHTPPLADLEKDIRKQLVEDQSGNKVYEATSEIEDRLAGGEDFDALKDEYKLQIISVKDATLSDAKIDSGDLALTDAQKKAILQKAFGSAENESSTFSDLSDNRFYSVRVDKVTPSAPKAFADVKDAIAKRWVEENQARENLSKAQALADDLNSGKTKLDATGKSVSEVTLSRNPEKNKDLPSFFGKDPSVMNRFMDAEEGKFIFSTPASTNSILVGEVVSTKLGSSTPEGSDQDELVSNLRSDTAMANMMIFFNLLQTKYPVEINQDLLKRIYGHPSTEE